MSVMNRLRDMTSQTSRNSNIKKLTVFSLKSSDLAGEIAYIAVGTKPITETVDT